MALFNDERAIKRSCPSFGIPRLDRRSRPHLGGMKERGGRKRKKEVEEAGAVIANLIFGAGVTVGGAFGDFDALLEGEGGQLAAFLLRTQG